MGSEVKAPKLLLLLPLSRRTRQMHGVQVMVARRDECKENGDKIATYQAKRITTPLLRSVLMPLVSNEEGKLSAKGSLPLPWTGYAGAAEGGKLATTAPAHTNDTCARFANRRGTWVLNGDYICAGECCKIPWGPGGPIGVIVGLAAIRAAWQQALGTFGFGITCLALSSPRSSSGAAATTAAGLIAGISAGAVVSE
eukprot:jgi/Bigna1/79753/fgenesh1_pg.65_\